MRKLDTNVSPSFQHGIAVGLNVHDADVRPKCHCCRVNRTDLRDADGHPICEDCRDEIDALRGKDE